VAQKQQGDIPAAGRAKMWWRGLAVLRFGDIFLLPAPEAPRKQVVVLLEQGTEAGRRLANRIGGLR
jgi:hypothetical protein